MDSNRYSSRRGYTDDYIDNARKRPTSGVDFSKLPMVVLQKYKNHFQLEVAEDTKRALVEACRKHFMYQPKIHEAEVISLFLTKNQEASKERHKVLND